MDSRAGEAVSVLLADDHPALDGTMTDGLARDDHVTIVGHALDRREAIDLVRTLDPEVVLLDVTDAETHGAAATREIRKLAPGTRVIVLTESHATSALGEAAESGAVGYVCTDDLAPDVLRLVVQLAAQMSRAGP